MRIPDRHLTKKQVLGITLLIMWVWVFAIGLAWTIFKDGRDGFIISGVGAIGSGVTYAWLGFIHPDNQ